MQTNWRNYAANLINVIASTSADLIYTNYKINIYKTKNIC